MSGEKSILMVASECDALPKAKVGGIGDVLRDVPKALAQLNCNVHILLPSYGYLHELEGAELIGEYEVPFARQIRRVGLYNIPLSATKYAGDDLPLSIWILDNSLFSAEAKGNIYVDDGEDRPFASDATKYALFCAAAAEAILEDAFGSLDILHLHDWHAATLAVLKEFDPKFKRLKNLKTVYTIHNLSLQGVRPFSGDRSSLQEWFPNLTYDKSQIADPCVSHCYNPMRAAIRLSDKVHAVSPTYAEEIQKPSKVEANFFGGEGLEQDLAEAAKQKRLLGILNGCEYPDTSYPRLSKINLCRAVRDTLLQWAAKSDYVSSNHWIAKERLQTWISQKEKGFILTSVGRITGQKVSLLKEPLKFSDSKKSALEHLLDLLEGKGTFILVGSGDKNYERFFLEVSSRRSHFLFLNGYSDELAQSLYASGDLFLMPSSFEPCGISQMLAMRAGQACLVHSVGGLNDTVIDGVSGFTFSGKTAEEQARNMLLKFEKILNLVKDSNKKLGAVSKLAAKSRFDWQSSAQEYLDRLYEQ